ncbi:hypothetical protein PRIPAC_87691 [Pristionchus pacificus]|uniref:Uncharacterized protein n=1 Tax=Pristionchus pacificus TaxID=54126 RepID=A0A2A6B723_PRIPA|nr:hypothetical protein PRIPAC_87691 [Pristionchus pacificus]|eukprot:PDM61675.1 hypothetical protein PRIPAC_51117 [Pristionchus pacificus]
MKSLFPIFVLLLSIYAAPDKFAFVKKVTDLLRSEKANTKGELNRVGCYAVLCHFEDKNGCQTQCRKLEKLIMMNSCSVLLMNLPTKSNVQTTLCRTVFSYSNWRKYTKEARDATRKAFKQFKTHIH